MDLEIAEPATDLASGELARRQLLTRAGLVGLAGLAGALIVDRSAFASPAADRPNVPTEADRAVLDQVIKFELAASELYRVAASSVSEDLAAAAGLMAENHQAYAHAVAGKTGLSASEMNSSIFSTFSSAFGGTDTEFLTAAHTLEQTAVTTHTELMADYESSDAIAVAASILVVEARHATVLASILEVNDLDVLFGNDQPALSLSGDA